MYHDSKNRQYLFHSRINHRVRHSEKRNPCLTHIYTAVQLFASIEKSTSCVNIGSRATLK